MSYNVKTRNLDNVQAVVQVSKINKQLVKFGVNRYLDCALLVKRPLGWFDNAVLSAGVAVTGLLKHQIAVKNGFELAINL